MLRTTTLVPLVIVLLAPVNTALAYIGPGAGISVLGSLLSILATIFVAIGAILFWPVRKFMKRRKAGRVPRLDTETDSSGDDAKSDNTRG